MAKEVAQPPALTAFTGLANTSSLIWRIVPGVSQGLQWIVHLGMTGRLLVADPATSLSPHTHAVLHLKSGKELRFVDPPAIRTPGAPRRLPPKRRKPSASREPVRSLLTVSPPDEFAALLRDFRHTSIKAALLNQKLLHGVGNIYADESLFRAGIRPRRMARHLKRAELDRLHTSLQNVLREAISLGGSSVSDYVDAASHTGFFQLEHRVYLRTGQPCLVCGKPIQRILLWLAAARTIAPTASARFGPRSGISMDSRMDCLGAAS